METFWRVYERISVAIWDAIYVAIVVPPLIVAAFIVSILLAIEEQFRG